MARQQHNEFAELERQLAAVQPSDSQVDRAELLFRAGQASVRTGAARANRLVWLWPLSTALLALVAVGLSWQLYRVDKSSIAEQIKYVPVRIEATVAEESLDTASEPFVLTSDSPASAFSGSQDAQLERDHYVHQRRLALSVGLDALGEPHSAGESELSGLRSYRDLKAIYRDYDRSVGAEETRRQNERL